MRLKKAFSCHRPHSLVDIIRSSLIWLIPRINIPLTLQLPLVTKTEFLLTTSVQYQADKWWEWREISIMSGVRSISWSNTKFSDQNHKNCMADSKENYCWDLGSERVNRDPQNHSWQEPIASALEQLFFFSCQWHSPIYPPASVLAR